MLREFLLNDELGTVPVTFLLVKETLNAELLFDLDSEILLVLEIPVP